MEERDRRNRRRKTYRTGLQTRARARENNDGCLCEDLPAWSDILSPFCERRDAFGNPQCPTIGILSRTCI